MMFLKTIITIIILIYTTVLSSEITKDTVSFQVKKKRQIESKSIFELNMYVQPIGLGECYNSSKGTAHEILKEFSGSLGFSLFGRMINKKHILKLSLNYLITKLEYNSWAVVIPIPEKTFHDELINSLLLKSTYELITFSNKSIHLNPFVAIGIGVDVPISLILNTESGFVIFYNRFGIISSFSYRPFGRSYRRAFNCSFGFVFRIKN